MVENSQVCARPRGGLEPEARGWQPRRDETGLNLGSVYASRHSVCAQFQAQMALS